MQYTFAPQVPRILTHDETRTADADSRAGPAGYSAAGTLPAPIGSRVSPGSSRRPAQDDDGRGQCPATPRAPGVPPHERCPTRRALRDRLTTITREEGTCAADFTLRGDQEPHLRRHHHRHGGDRNVLGAVEDSTRARRLCRREPPWTDSSSAVRTSRDGGGNHGRRGSNYLSISHAPEAVLDATSCGREVLQESCSRSRRPATTCVWCGATRWTRCSEMGQG